MLMELSKVCGERLKSFLRDAFPHILEGMKVPNKVMSGYVDECILSLIKTTVFKSALQPLSQEVKENKSKMVREKCLVRKHSFEFVIMFSYTSFFSQIGISTGNLENMGNQRQRN
jgi:hypothetical protein